MTDTPSQPDTPQDGETPLETLHLEDASKVATWFVMKLVILTLAVGAGEAYLHSIEWGGWLQEFVASVSVWMLGWVEPGIVRDGNNIIGSRAVLVVTLECTALFAKGLYCVGVIAFPARWRDRGAGFALGILGVGVLNIFRVAGLVLIARRIPGFFDFAHLVLMQWFLVSCVAPLWLVWAVWASRRAKNALSIAASKPKEGANHAE